MNIISNPGVTDVESFFYDTRRGRIFCTMVGNAASSDECVIYFAPLFEERMWSQRIAFNFARELWRQREQPVFIFDYFGYGESEGGAEEFSLSRCRKDMEALLGLLKVQYCLSRFVPWGIRSGCAVALSTLSAHPDVSSFVFWAPVLNINDLIYQGLRSSIAGQMFLFKEIIANRDEIIEELVKHGKCLRRGHVLNTIDGYRFGKAFYEETLTLDCSELLNRVVCPVLFLQVIVPGKRKGRSIPKTLDASSSSKVYREEVTAQQFWLNLRDYSQRTETIYQHTIEWLGNRSPHISCGMHF